MVNNVKRKSLKTIARAVTGATVASQAPLSLAAGITNQANAAISISHIETVFGQTVIIKNLSDKPALLKSLNPSRISTPSGEFDMNTLLSRGALKINGATTQAINISEDGRIHNWAFWDTLESTVDSIVDEGAVRPVDVLIHHHSLATAPNKLVQTGVFA